MAVLYRRLVLNILIFFPVYLITNAESQVSPEQADPAPGPVIRFTSLEQAVNSARALLNSSYEGQAEGEYPPGSKADLEESIATAEVFIGIDTVQSVIENQISVLYNACSTFESRVQTTTIDMVDMQATKQTRYLWMNLRDQMFRSIMFGMQHATGYGVGWTNDDDRSDIKDVCGDFPAIYGEEMRNLVQGVDVERFRYRIISAYSRGGVITICWHQLDPDNRHYYASEINDEKIVSQILPGGPRHLDYLAKLHIVAEFFKSLRGDKGEAIPVIFRPYHEHLGSWFWWGVGHCTIAEFNELWQFTVNYLHDVKNVHNLIWAISPNLEYVDEDGEYFERFPGDDYVDIYGVDFYNNGPVPAAVLADYTKDLHVVVRQALTHGKIPVLTEMGQEGLDDINWHTRMLINPIKHDSVNNAIAYAVTWRNANYTHFHAPYPGHPSVPDFIDFYNDPYTLFESDLPDMYSMPEPDLAAPVFTHYPESLLVSPTELVELMVETDERASLRWSFIDQAYDDMPNSFGFGQRQYAHTTFIASQQGSEQQIYLRAMDVHGNKSNQSLSVIFNVDTLQAEIIWYEHKYNSASWQDGNASFGSGTDVSTKIPNITTAYFVKDFMLTEKPTGARILLQYNGGFAIYLNGKEIARYYLPQDVALDYDIPPVSTARGAKAVDFTPDMLEKLNAGSNRLGIEVHGGTANVQYFDALMQTNIEMPFYYGSGWHYYDTGDMPHIYTLGEILTINPVRDRLPEETMLYQNFPNPFNPVTRISFFIKEAGPASVVIFNTAGQKVKTLINAYLKAGRYESDFDATGLASGVYILALKIGVKIQSRKMILLR